MKLREVEGFAKGHTDNTRQLQILTWVCLSPDAMLFLQPKTPPCKDNSLSNNYVPGTVLSSQLIQKLVDTWASLLVYLFPHGMQWKGS